MIQPARMGTVPVAEKRSRNKFFGGFQLRLARHASGFLGQLGGFSGNVAAVVIRRSSYSKSRYSVNTAAPLSSSRPTA